MSSWSPERRRENNQKIENRTRRTACRRALRQRRRAELDAIRRKAGCVDCGIREGLLHFDHRPGEVKLFQVSASSALGSLSWDKIEAEVAKCDVRCAPCHQSRHVRGR